MKFWFSKIANRDDALKLIRRSAVLFFMLAGMNVIVSLFSLSLAPDVRSLASIPADFVTDAVGTVIIIIILATILRVFNSRTAAIMLVLLYIAIAASIMSKATPGNVALAFIGIFVATRATYATFKLHGQFASNKNDQSDAKPYDVEKWQAVLKYDKDIALIAEKLQPLGEKWIDQFAHDFLALNDKRYLPEIVQRVMADARQAGQAVAPLVPAPGGEKNTAFFRFDVKRAKWPLILWSSLALAFSYLVYVGTNAEFRKSPVAITTSAGHTDFIRGVVNSCAERRRKNLQNATSLMDSDGYCRCFGEKLAPLVTVDEIREFDGHNEPAPSLRNKIKWARDECVSAAIKSQPPRNIFDQFDDKKLPPRFDDLPDERHPTGKKDDDEWEDVPEKAR